MRRSWLVVLAALVLAGGLFGIGYVVANSGDGSSGTSSGTFDAFNHDRLSVMFGDGSMPRMFRGFEQMMNEVRLGMTPEQRQRMDGDALWKLMQSGAFDRMMDSHSGTLQGMPGMGMGGGHHGDGSHSSALRHDRMAVLFADGSMPRMFQSFEQMMTEIRAGPPTELQQRMDRDAMWKLMQSGDFDQMMGNHASTLRGMPGMGMGGGGGNGHGSGGGMGP
jgi:hypothetical protein